LATQRPLDLALIALARRRSGGRSFLASIFWMRARAPA
jgi:hypothetical protein